MKKIALAFFTILAVADMAYACGFTTKPASVDRYYLAGGWQLQGVDDADTTFELRDPRHVIPDLHMHVLAHKSHFLVEFPTAEFNLNDEHRIMPSQFMKAYGSLRSVDEAWVIRWETDDGSKVVAYTYEFAPAIAHRENGKLIEDTEALCVFYVTFIDDKGDGVFRLMVDGSLTPDLLPEWFKKPRT